MTGNAQLRTEDFDYDLPRQLIAQEPLEVRDASRLLVLNRADGSLEHRHFRDLPDYLLPGDILAANDSKVIPARLFATKTKTGGKVEILLLERLESDRWQALVGGKRVGAGTALSLYENDGFANRILATVEKDLGGAQRILRFNVCLEDELLERLGHTPLPPYITRPLAEPERYQTVYAQRQGSSAAPTAGLHFTGDLLLSLREKGVLFETVTLHIGLDTFKPVEEDSIVAHEIHTEWAALDVNAARRINDAKLAGGRLIAVGTTATRVLETAALRSAGIQGSLRDISGRDAAGETSNVCPWRPVAAFSGRTDLYIYPGYRFRAVDALLTNFHLPRSTLLMMVSAFAGRDLVLHAYEVAVAEEYRFYSFGDAMLIL